MTPGAVRFVRYAYPPNALGYCGPDDGGALLEYGVAGVVDGGLRALIEDFEGAWPYLELIAHASLKDPLDDDVVEAYWIGNELLGRVDMSTLGDSAELRFRRRAGRSWSAIGEAITAGARPSHAFHVFCVYPWVGLMRTGMTTEPLRILDQCRIRWGKVLEISGDLAAVESRPLQFDGDRLSLGLPRCEEVRWASGGKGFEKVPDPGDQVSLHWGWLCERLDDRGVKALSADTAGAMRLANRVLARPRVGVLI